MKKDYQDPEVVLTAIRREYLKLKREGVTHQDMADATGLPISTFSMWLGGYRNITKLDKLSALVTGLPALQVML